MGLGTGGFGTGLGLGSVEMRLGSVGLVTSGLALIGLVLGLI